MKVTNWCRKLVAAIVAGGALTPGLIHAVSIPLGDDSFEAYNTNPHGGFAYSQPNPVQGYTGGYGSTSPWVDDLNSPLSPSQVQHTQDDTESNWLYNAAYAELPGGSGHYRGSPRTGNQAMHGLHSYSAQVTSTNFAAEKFYTFSIWAQGDADASAADDSVYLYLFKGNVPFSEANSLTFKAFQGGPGGDFAKRGANGPVTSAAASKNNWTQISITHIVYPDSPEVGQPIGVGFYGQRDAAVDDATLDVDDAANHLLVLEVRTTDGQVRIRNQTAAPIRINYYDIKSTNGALNAVAWNSLQEQNLAGFPAGNGSGNGWEQAGGSSSTAVGESYLTGNSSVGNGTNVGLGAAFNVGGTHDLVFEYGAILSSGQNATGDYNSSGIVDAGDYVTWRKNNGTQANYVAWRQHFGDTTSFPPSTLFRGLVHYVTSFSAPELGSAPVPEPTSVILAGVGFATVLIGGRRKR